MLIWEPMPMDNISEEDELCETDHLDELCDESFFILIFTYKEWIYTWKVIYKTPTVIG